MLMQGPTRGAGSPGILTTQSRSSCPRVYTVFMVCELKVFGRGEKRRRMSGGMIGVGVEVGVEVGAGAGARAHTQTDSGLLYLRKREPAVFLRKSILSSTTVMLADDIA